MFAPKLSDIQSILRVNINHYQEGHESHDIKNILLDVPPVLTKELVIEMIKNIMTSEDYHETLDNYNYDEDLLFDFISNYDKSIKGTQIIEFNCSEEYEDDYAETIIFARGNMFNYYECPFNLYIGEDNQIEFGFKFVNMQDKINELSKKTKDELVFELIKH